RLIAPLCMSSMPVWQSRQPALLRAACSAVSPHIPSCCPARSPLCVDSPSTRTPTSPLLPARSLPLLLLSPFSLDPLDREARSFFSVPMPGSPLATDAVLFRTALIIAQTIPTPRMAISFAILHRRPLIISSSPPQSPQRQLG